MKIIRKLLKKTSPEKPDAMQLQPRTGEEEAVVVDPPEKGLVARFIAVPFGNLKDRLARKKPAPAAGAEGASGEKQLNIPDLENVKQKLSGLIAAKKHDQTVKTVLMVAGAGVAAAGIAADVAFMGGIGTITVLSCAYSDLRNAQHIKKISAELTKIDEKIDSLKKERQHLPDYAPALTAVKSSIEDFQASARKLPPEVAEDLAALKSQVSALQEKIAPANDDVGTPSPVAKPPARGGI